MPCYLEIFLKIGCVCFLGFVEIARVISRILQRFAQAARVFDEILRPDEDMPRERARDGRHGQMRSEVRSKLHLLDHKFQVLEPDRDIGSLRRGHVGQR